MQRGSSPQWFFRVALALDLAMGELAGCDLTRQQYTSSPACLGESRQFWERLGSHHGVVCTFDASALNLDCNVPGGCVDAPVSRSDEPLQQVVYDCGTCGSGAQALQSVPCCELCLQIQQNGMPEPPVRGSYEVVCKGCDHLEALRGEPGRARLPACAVNGTAFRCDTEGACLPPAPTVATRLQACRAVPCDRCACGTALRARCCAECLRSACAQGPRGRHVCRGCSTASEPVLPLGERRETNATTIQSICSETAPPGAALDALLLYIVQPVLGISLAVAALALCSGRLSAAAGPGHGEEAERRSASQEISAVYDGSDREDAELLPLVRWASRSSSRVPAAVPFPSRRGSGQSL